MMQGVGWIAWETREAPALPGAKPTPTPKPVREKPIQEWQFGSNIDSLPIEHNTPAPAGVELVTGENKDRVGS